MKRIASSILGLVLLLVSCGQGSQPVDNTDRQSPNIQIAINKTVFTEAGQLKVAAMATDNVGIKSVVFYKNGSQVGEDFDLPYEITLDIDVKSKGENRISAKASDSSGNIANSTDLALTVAIGWPVKIADTGETEIANLEVDQNDQIIAYGDGGALVEGTGGTKKDLILSYFDKDGILIKKNIVGTSSGDYASKMIISKSGNKYISGYTYGSFNNVEVSPLDSDAFVAKLDNDDKILWVLQFGKANLNILPVSLENFGEDILFSYKNVSYENGVVKTTNLLKIDTNGQIISENKIDSIDAIRDIKIDSLNNIFIVSDQTEFPAYSVYLSKYDNNLVQLWKKKIKSIALAREGVGLTGTNPALSIHLNNVYIMTSTKNILSDPIFGIIVPELHKCSSDGNLIWTKDFQIDPKNPYAKDIRRYQLKLAIDNSGDILFVTQDQNSDASIYKIRQSGEIVWEKTTGLEERNRGSSVGLALDSQNNIYFGVLAFVPTSSGFGRLDVFVTSLSPSGILR